MKNDSFLTISKFLLACYLFYFVAVYKLKKQRKIFIIGGGHRSDVTLMTQLVTLADLGKKDYVVVLRTAKNRIVLIFISRSNSKLTPNPIAYVKF
jgi:hypothetical protein